MKKICALFIILVLLLTGCNATKTEEVKQDKTKTLVVGLDDTFAPMGFRDDKGELVGFDIDLAKAVAEKVANHEVEKGIVICGTGIGISIAANKVKGIRCGLCTNKTMARLTREHNDANVLSMGQRIIGIEVAKDIVHTFLSTPFSNGERHVRRIEKLAEMEK